MTSSNADPQDARLEIMETKVDYQDRIIDDLNQVVVAQQRQIDQLIQDLERLDKILENVTEASVEGGDEPPPPHY